MGNYLSNASYSSLSSYFYWSKEASQPKISIQDCRFQLIVQSKRMRKQSEKSMKQYQKYKKKAKDEMIKNNEQSAKLYLASAASKKQQAINRQRLGLKMQFMADNVNNMSNNQQMMNSFGKMAQTLSSIINPNFEDLSNNISKFQNAMDQMMIGGKLIEQMMSQKATGVDTTVENMYEALKQQMALDVENNLNDVGMGKQKKKQLEAESKA